MKEIPLTRGLFASVDDEDYPLVSSRIWSARPCCRTVYAQSGLRLPNGKKTTVQMHRLILDAKPGEIIDHIDGNGLNNRRSNLRLCSASQNARNCTGRYRNPLGVKGVRPYRGKWLAQIRGNHKTIYLGLFATPDEAAAAYDAAAIQYHRQFARTNADQVVSVGHLIGGPSRAYRRRGKSGFRGVYQRGNKWGARLSIGNRQVHIGFYQTAELAARAYDRAALKKFGPTALVNFPEKNVEAAKRIMAEVG